MIKVDFYDIDRSDPREDTWTWREGHLLTYPRASPPKEGDSVCLHTDGRVIEAEGRQICGHVVATRSRNPEVFGWELGVWLKLDAEPLDQLGVLRRVHGGIHSFSHQTRGGVSSRDDIDVVVQLLREASDEGLVEGYAPHRNSRSARPRYDSVFVHGLTPGGRARLTELAEARVRSDRSSAAEHDEGSEWDVFISYASEDKEAVARPLFSALTSRGLRVWFDDDQLSLGDRLPTKIDEGLARSRFAVVILSERYFAKHWPRQELEALFAREDQGAKIILPVWHELDHDEIKGHSPILASRLGIPTATGMNAIADAIMKVL